MFKHNPNFMQGLRFSSILPVYLAVSACDPLEEIGMGDAVGNPIEHLNIHESDGADSAIDSSTEVLELDSAIFIQTLEDCLSVLSCPPHLSTSLPSEACQQGLELFKGTVRETLIRKSETQDWQEFTGLSWGGMTLAMTDSRADNPDSANKRTANFSFGDLENHYQRTSLGYGEHLKSDGAPSLSCSLKVNGDQSSFRVSLQRGDHPLEVEIWTEESPLGPAMSIQMPSTDEAPLSGRFQFGEAVWDTTVMQSALADSWKFYSNTFESLPRKIGPFNYYGSSSSASFQYFSESAD